MLTKFLASKASGWISIALLAALAAGGVWFWHELKSFGSLEAVTQAQAADIKLRDKLIADISKDRDSRQRILEAQQRQNARLRQNAQLQMLAIQEAQKHASKAINDCMSMRIADGMRFGPSREDEAGEDEARPGVDG